MGRKLTLANSKNSALLRFALPGGSLYITIHLSALAVHFSGSTPGQFSSSTLIHLTNTISVPEVAIEVLFLLRRHTLHFVIMVWSHTYRATFSWVSSRISSIRKITKIEWYTVKIFRKIDHSQNLLVETLSDVFFRDKLNAANLKLISSTVLTVEFVYH